MCSCTEFIQFAVDDVDQNLSLLDALTNSMEWNPTGLAHTQGNPSKNCENG